MAISKPILITIPELRVLKKEAEWGDVMYIVQEHRQETFRKRWVDVTKAYYNLTSAKAAMATKVLAYMAEGEFNGVNR